MQKTLSHIVSVALATALAASLLAACGQGKERASPTDQDAAKQDPVDIAFYRPHTSMKQEDFMELIGNPIAKKFPFVNVKYIPDEKGSRMEDVLGTGQNLDILIVSIGYINDFVKYGLQYDLSETIRKEKYNLNALEPSMVEFLKKTGNGSMHALPIFTTAAVLMYNKDLFDKFGVPYPKAGMTWDDTYDLAQKLSRKDGGSTYYGFGTSISHMLSVNQLSLPYADPKTFAPLITTEDYRKLALNFSRFYTIPGFEFTNDMLKNPGDMFVNGKNLAMYAYFNSAMVNAPAEMNIDAVPLPSFKEKPGVGSQMYPTFAGVASISKNKDIAFQILSYMTSDEMQTHFARVGIGLPVVKKPEIIRAFGGEKPQLKGKNIEAFYPEKPAPIFIRTDYDPIIERNARTAFNEVSQALKDPVTAFREAEEKSKKEIEAARGK